MTHCPLHRRLFAVFIVLSSMAVPVSSMAADASLPFRDMPGFRCNRWNVKNECVDWSYYRYNTVAPGGYGGSVSSPVLRRSFPTLQCGVNNVNCNDLVSIRARATPNPAIRGEIITYTLYVRNDDSQLRSVNVRAFMDDDVAFESATYGGYSDGDVARWENLRIPARSSRSLTLRVRVHANASNADPIALRAQTDRSVDSVLVNVQDSGFYGNAIKVLDDGIYVRYNRYSGQQQIERPQYYHDEYRSIRRYGGSSSSNYYYYNNSPGYSCDPERFICQ